MVRTTDRAIEAAKLARSAEESFVYLVAQGEAAEYSPDFRDAETRWLAAEEAFADAVPCTRAGTLLKVDALLELLRAAGANDDSLEVRHLRSVAVYLTGPVESAEANVLSMWGSRV